MKQLILVFGILFGSIVNVFPQAKDVYAFKAGEKLVYRVFYSSAIIDATAGEAVLSIEEDVVDLPGKNDSLPVYKITGTGYSKGLFDFFYPVRDTFESYVNKETLLPYKFKRATHEGNYERQDLALFYRDSLKAESLRKTIDLPEDAFDMISALYYMRLVDINDFDKDSMFSVKFYLDDSVYISAIKFVGRDTVKTNLGRLPTLKYAPMMATGEVFAKKYPMYVWVTDDKNHIPVLASSEIIVGSVKMELINYKNLKSPFINPVKKKKKKKKNRE